ncbi:hypothetical protein I317_06694 [Kwoniella heveanensis CBS 569]|nr:hypothetical protein I317_06694 [Kwoniella heveanensis CBS 569]
MLFPFSPNFCGGKITLSAGHGTLVDIAVFAGSSRPADANPDASSFNYACLVAGAVWIFATVYWYLPKIGGKTFFRGPQTHDPTVEHVDFPVTTEDMADHTNKTKGGDHIGLQGGSSVIRVQSMDI